MLKIINTPRLEMLAKLSRDPTATPLMVRHSPSTTKRTRKAIEQLETICQWLPKFQ
ncbi:Uncharacterized protein APZ42_017204 [Daphnia magna]|uniref:Uncharacterized protein n=1 Tax=Daphnia magna TaxID=35525 RepID=A0A164ZQM8_9CRUS|nr:Uncharacterized protein APZ42_017204 [Daphnia magna]